MDPRRYPERFRPPGGIDGRTFRSQASVALTTCHGHLDIVLRPDGPMAMSSSHELTRERLTGTELIVPVAAAGMILHSKTTANRPKDHAVLDPMREVLITWRSRGGHGPPDR